MLNEVLINVVKAVFIGQLYDYSLDDRNTPEFLIALGICPQIYPHTSNEVNCFVLMGFYHFLNYKHNVPQIQKHRTIFEESFIYSYITECFYS